MISISLTKLTSKVRLESPQLLAYIGWDAFDSAKNRKRQSVTAKRENRKR